MDYGSIISRAWRITWRYKVLWILGLFGGVSSGLGGSGTGYRGGGTSTSTSSSSALTGAQFNAVVDFLRLHAATIIGISVAVLVVGLVLFVLRVAARGGLIREVNEAQEEREVRVGAGWSAGFRRWWRILGIEFLTSLPILILGAIVGGFFIVVLVAALRRGFGTSGLTSALAGLAITGTCFVLVFALVAIVLGVILSIVVELALRYAMLQDQGVIASIRQGWKDLWSRRGAFVMWIIMVGVGIGYGIALAIVAVVLVLPGVFLMIAKAWVAGGIMLGVAFLVLLLPTAVYGTFHSAVWTLFFRRMTGADAVPLPAPGAYAPPAYPAPGYTPPAYAPPAAPMPPAPPAPPAPPVATAPAAPPAPPVPPATPEPSAPEPSAPTPPDGPDA